MATDRSHSLELRPKKLSEEGQLKPIPSPSYAHHKFIPSCSLVTYFYRECGHNLTDHETEFHIPSCPNSTISPVTPLPSPEHKRKTHDQDQHQHSDNNDVPPLIVCPKYNHTIYIHPGNCTASPIRSVTPTKYNKNTSPKIKCEPTLTESEKQKNRIFWIREREQDRKKVVEETMRDKMEEMASVRRMERKMNTRFEDREFWWDPSVCGGADDFLALVKGSDGVGAGVGGVDEGLGDEGVSGEGEKKGCKKCETDEGEDARICRICGKENTVNGEGFRMLPCGHIFDLECIVKHLGDNNNMPECPLCAKKFKLHKMPCYHFTGDPNCQCHTETWDFWGR